MARSKIAKVSSLTRNSFVCQPRFVTLWILIIVDLNWLSDARSSRPLPQTVASRMGVTLAPQMLTEGDLANGRVALPFAPPVPARELNLLRNPLRVESKAAAAFREESAGAFHAKPHPGLATQDSKQ